MCIFLLSDNGEQTGEVKSTRIPLYTPLYAGHSANRKKNLKIYSWHLIIYLENSVRALVFLETS